MSQIIARFAPSPTGHLHIGGARTALFNWLLARQSGGKFLLRIEDTDALRSTDEFTQAILKAMLWLKLDWDDEPIFQSQRLEIHKEYIERLLKQDKAYWCHCQPQDLEERRQKILAAGGKPKYDGLCRHKALGPAKGAVVRFKGPEDGDTAWDDLIKGPIVFNNQELDDLIILRSDGMPTYNMAVVVDDITMNITHTVRGDDHVNNTPRQILLYEAIGAPTPRFAHLPMILGADKTRLSKRHGATSVMAYKDMGYLPQALTNYLARLGWSYGDQEIFTLEEMVSVFSLGQVGRSAGVFNPEKLIWLNSHYIKETLPLDLVNLVWPHLELKGYVKFKAETMNKIMLSVQERGKTILELAEKAEFYFQDLPSLDKKASEKFLTPENKDLLKQWQQFLEKPLAQGKFEELMNQLAQEKSLKPGAVAQPLRVALTGQTASPGLAEVIDILGPEAIKKRIEAVL
ncbi:MAG: glutamate--tRNA ligase [Candidatus Adiutrix sp.]